MVKEPQGFQHREARPLPTPDPHKLPLLLCQPGSAVPQWYVIMFSTTLPEVGSDVLYFHQTIRSHSARLSVDVPLLVQAPHMHLQTARVSGRQLNRPHGYQHWATRQAMFG